MKSLKLLLRFLTVGGLVLLLLIPLLMIRGTVHDRERYRAQAEERVSQSMAGPQQLVGPLRVVPWTDTRTVAATGADGRPETRVETTEGYLYQTPETMDVSGGMAPDTRRIGLYDVRVFQWSAQLHAGFPELALTETEGRKYGQPYLVVGIVDVRGLVGTPKLTIDGADLALQSGTGAMSARMAGVHAMLPAPGADAAATLPASQLQLDFALAGTQSLGIAPVADSNRIRLHSEWPHPLFGGRFLPNDRTIDSKGFSASWEISSLASDAQAQLGRHDGEKLTSRQKAYGGAAMEGASVTAIDSIDVSLVDPVDVYTQADRASKYGILFVVLTFVGFALFELIKRLPIHPLQYLLVGLALAIFFLLLLSLSEHIEFWKAYLASAGACIGLQAVYLSGVLKSWRRAAGFAAMLTALYGVLYGLLVSENNALLMGSLLLFGILAAIMWVTRKVDWYELGSSLR
ncbi:cell envelope integrity protein CreD [Pseudoxanthomonas wuyuanensis]|uniref:Inner membrane protein n=1 Tax=Pseudoxanthomonas wuyuanensis TaxID=1073196 RepID=A0A286CV84_9GAMM|nr:cell envelope integrity protein CreD [Pseudoxanthomonas wuyuanensis]KAF1717349.1 cell envelope integrity protein CreD [Pseudoxanthomonas wuyuanensis]SOD50255.1 inner membrane protein [Pseudoxanthomonas wuyuanensis]